MVLDIGHCCPMVSLRLPLYSCDSIHRELCFVQAGVIGRLPMYHSKGRLTARRHWWIRFSMCVPSSNYFDCWLSRHLRKCLPSSGTEAACAKVWFDKVEDAALQMHLSNACLMPCKTFWTDIDCCLCRPLQKMPSMLGCMTALLPLTCGYGPQ